MLAQSYDWDSARQTKKRKKKQKRGYLRISVIPPCFIIVIIWSLECRLRGFFFSLTRLKYLEQTRVILSE